MLNLLKKFVLNLDPLNFSIRFLVPVNIDELTTIFSKVLICHLSYHAIPKGCLLTIYKHPTLDSRHNLLRIHKLVGEGQKTKSPLATKLLFSWLLFGWEGAWPLVPESTVHNVLQCTDLLLVVLGKVAEALAAQEEDGHLVERLARTHVVVLF